MPLSDQDRKIIFDKVKNVLKKFSPPMAIAKDKEDVFELMGNKPVPYGSKKVTVPGMYFSSVVARKDMISYYFFPMYMDQGSYDPILVNSKKYLKGKTCFNYKKVDQVDEKELSAILKKGVTVWKKLGYMN